MTHEKENEVQTIKVCACCKETLIELAPGDDPLIRWICQQCYITTVEPDRAAGEKYNQ